MSIKYQYLIFIILIHAIIAGLSYYILRDQKWYFLLTEVGIIGSLYLSYRIYNNFIKPIDLMKTGVDAIKDEDFNVKFLKTGSGEINGLIEVFNKMLEKLRQERVTSQEQSYFLESIISASPIGMILLDYDDKLTTINPAARDILSIKSVDQIDLSKIPSDVVQRVLAIPIGQSDLISIDNVNRYRCQVNSVVHRGFNRKFIMIEELSKELLENEKKAYGKVIRMMAHEVNNSMGAINSILDTVIDFGLDQPEDQDFADSLKAAKNRNNDLALFMKNFAEVVRLPDPIKKDVNINELLMLVRSIMSSQAESHTIEIQLDLPSDPVKLYCDPNQMQQILINAVKNSIESIGESGAVTLRASHKCPQIVVIDNGAGITKEHQDKLFTPFYSSKPTGQGIGLILIRDILLNHGANFRLYSTEDLSQTRFEMSF